MDWATFWSTSLTQSAISAAVSAVVAAIVGFLFRRWLRARLEPFILQVTGLATTAAERSEDAASFAASAANQSKTAAKNSEHATDKARQGNEATLWMAQELARANDRAEQETARGDALSERVLELLGALDYARAGKEPPAASPSTALFTEQALTGEIDPALVTGRHALRTAAIHTIRQEPE